MGKRFLKFMTFFIIGVASMDLVIAQNPQQSFDRANQLVQRQAYDSAVAIYSQLISDGYHNKEVYFNAGNAYFKEGRYSHAIYYYTKALQKAPANKDIRHNLRLAQLQASDKVQQISPLFFVRWWHVVLQFFRVNTWLIGSIFFFWVFVFFLGWSLLITEPPKFSKRLRIPAAVLFCFFFLGAVFSLKAANSHDTAIIVSVENPLRAAPDENSSAVQQLQDGSKVEILDSVEYWKKIRLIDGTEGWFNGKDLKAL